jgi:ferredoxin-type protein NapG
MASLNQNNTGNSNKTKLDRRGFFILCGKLAVVIAFGALLRLSENNVQFKRPPTALPESEFLSLCTRCRKCVDACPNRVIKPVAITESIVSAGTPRLNEVSGICTFYDRIPCIGYCALVC